MLFPDPLPAAKPPDLGGQRAFSMGYKVYCRRFASPVGAPHLCKRHFTFNASHVAMYVVQIVAVISG